MERKHIFDTVVTLGSYTAFIDNIFRIASQKVPAYVCFANVHMLMEAHCDPSFQRVVNQASIVAPDGKPLSVFLKMFHNLQQDRVCGMDILPDLLQRAEATGKSVYFYGCTDECLEKIVARAKTDFPKLSIAGYYSPPFRQLTEEEKQSDLDRIRDADPDLMFVSLGCPKQEKWMAENCKKLSVCMLGVGQAFTVYAQLEKRLPAWMRMLCLEWTYRLVQEPGRLWRRYLFTNGRFLFMTGQYALASFMGRAWRSTPGFKTPPASIDIRRSMSTKVS